MSSIYINEPPTTGKILLETTAGDIDIELWSKETPKACRNFVQLCMEGYYDGIIFHRVVKDFIVQGGDPTGTGEGGESVYGKPFKDEFHSRLRFNRRGMVGMANAGPNDNGSQFFFTMAATPELQNKHTIFGKVTGNTVYNLIKLQESEVDGSDKPLHPYKIIKTQILSNPFDDIEPRAIKRKEDKNEEKKPKSQSKATKNFNLLSFGEEAEEDEEENVQVTKDLKIKSKSSHDLTDDPRLSSKPAVDIKTEEKKKPTQAKSSSEDSDSDSESSEPEQKKFKKEKDSKKEEIEEKVEPVKSRSDELKEESRKLQKELRHSKKKKSSEADENTKEEQSKPIKNDAISEYKQEQEKYKQQKRTLGKKGSSREELTLMMLSQFKNQLESVKTIAGDYSDDEEDKKEEDEDLEAADDSDLSWMRHTLKFDEKRNKVLDANIHDTDRYEIYDPRNPMNKRRREASNKDKK
ncbi:spliceosome-associated protein CWC27 homolog [Patella vulgata]|uniref:spliceosome-associated protein CWC27 homolog n=1 Tax=Patella vulgata TaxID=6465 RepID=UPI002180415C|nr:spliceosome-associated protein CWC27 homolog [Patella vulgata]